MADMNGFVAPGQALLQGVQQGLPMGMQMAEAQRVRKQQDWENDYKVMSAGIQLANTKGISKESKAKILNSSVKPLWDKYNPKSPFPEISDKNVETIEPVVKNLYELGKQASEDKVSWDTVWGEANAQIANYHTKTAQEEDVNDKQKAALEAALAPIKSGYEASQKKKTMESTFTLRKTALANRSIPELTGAVTAYTKMANEAIPGTPEAESAQQSLAAAQSVLDEKIMATRGRTTPPPAAVDPQLKLRAAEYLKANGGLVTEANIKAVIDKKLVK